MSAFRVLAGPSQNPAKVYDGDDIAAALQVLWDALPDGSILIEHSVHAVTGEPALVIRDGDTGKVAAALYGYGITAEEWRLAYEFWSMLGDEDDIRATRQ